MKISKTTGKKLLIVAALLLAVVISLSIVSTNYIKTHDEKAKASTSDEVDEPQAATKAKAKSAKGR